jgi:hypothetical protein
VTVDPPHGEVACFATQGSGSLDEQRITTLLADFAPDVFPFERRSKGRSLRGLRSTLRERRPKVVVMEGTGIAGGLALLTLPQGLGVRYVVSSGDAVGPYLAKRHWALGLAGGLYERILLRRCSGFIGWTPYLAGRALTFGAPRAMTAAGWARSHPTPDARARWRERLGIGERTLVFGLVGSLHWTKSVEYTYGLELVRAVRRARREDLCVCIVGDGTGHSRLIDEAGDELGRRVLLPGRIAASEVANVVAAFDVASLPQSTDGVGSFRYTTKLPEYLASGVPVVTGEIPAAYDLDGGWLWRLAGDAPWDEKYVSALADLMDSLTVEELARHTEAARSAATMFDAEEQRQRVTAFVRDILAS